MPAIFHRTLTGWVALPVSPPRGLLRLVPIGYEPASVARPAPPDSLLLVRIDPERTWGALLPDGARVTVNGQPVPAGMRILAHRDALALTGAGPVFFSTEETASVEPFAGPDQVTCPRCKLDIATGAPAVKCPGCGVFHHETGERPCWTYASVCAVCPQSTALGAGLQWTPEVL